MILSSEARAERKKGHLARVAAKQKLQKACKAAESITDKKKKQEAMDVACAAYSDFYIGQPIQKAKAEINEKIRKAQTLRRQGLKDLDMARATGTGFEAAEIAIRDSTIAIRALEELKRVRFRPQTGAQLTGGDV